MRISTLRRVDRWVGAPLCALLTALERLKKIRVAPGTALRTQHPAPHPAPGTQHPAPVVFIKLAEQGSTVLAWPAVSNAIARVGRDRVFFVVFEENRQILDAVEWIPSVNVLAIPTRSLWSVALGAWRAIRRLRSLDVGAAVDLEFFARSSAILSYLSGARHRVGFHAYAGEASYRGDLCTHKVVFNPYLHTSQAFEILVDALDQPPGRLPAYDARPPAARPLPEFRPAASDVAAVRPLLLEAAGRTASPIVLLNSNASDLMPLRRWPFERYVELARRILERYPSASVIFTGAPSEAAATDNLVREVASPRCTSVAGKTTLRGLLALYTLSDVLVTNDSGPAHFAALTPIEIVTLFGPETPALFAALTPRNHALWAGIVCSPCLNAFNDRQSRCTDNVCMQRLSVDLVFETVCSVLREPAALAGPRGLRP